MKKISIMLLAALMLFAFVACEPDTEEPAEATLVTPLAGTDKAIVGETEVTVSNLQENVKILADGTVEGTLKYYEVGEGWDVADETEGLYLAVELNLEAGDKYQVVNPNSEGAKDGKEIEVTAEDNTLMIYLGKTKESVQDSKVTITLPEEDGTYGETPDLTLTFKTVDVTGIPTDAE